MSGDHRSLEFKNLPLVEVAVRVYFDARVQVDFALVTALHKALTESKHDFPDVKPAAILEVSPVLEKATQLPSQPGDLPGAEYSGGRQGLMLQLQPQLLAVRWRHGISELSPRYPRFGALRRQVESSLGWMARYPAATQSRPAVVNMTYLNFIRVDDPRPYLHDSFRTRAADDARSLQEQIVAWQAPDGIDLRYEVRGAERTMAEEKESGYLLVTTAGRRLEREADAIGCLDEVHEKLQRLFEGLISRRAKVEWGLDSGSSEAAA